MSHLPGPLEAHLERILLYYKNDDGDDEEESGEDAVDGDLYEATSPSPSPRPITPTLFVPGVSTLHLFHYQLSPR